VHEALPPSATVRPQPLIAVRDVEASSRWYARLLGAERLGEDTHGNVYDRIVSRGRLILQLHAWDEEEHPNLVNPKAASLGHGVLLWFEVDDFDAAVKRARALKADVVQPPHLNPGPQHREIWLRDPDGYIVVICSVDGEAAS
jgi:catechol 2,3-dioxygenase-like lactoylglutathione lyase family enzyme